MLTIERYYLNRLCEVTDIAGRSLDFTSPAGKNNPIANFALAWSFYYQEHIRLTGKAPEETYFYGLHRNWYTNTRYKKRGAKKPQKTKTKGKGSIKTILKTGQSDMFAAQNMTKVVIDYDELIHPDDLAAEAMGDPDDFDYLQGE
jgi:hypothetical protein